MKRVLLYLWHCLYNLITRSAIVDSGSIAVVTLTSHGDRISRAFAAIESIGRGLSKPRRIILYLGIQYAGALLPAALRRLQRRGLEIAFVEDIGPHTKYYPYLLASERFDAPLVTADDDKLYPGNWLAGLLDAHREHSQTIHCWRAREILIGPEGLRPYGDWPLCTHTRSAASVLATGVGGVIYPPAFLQALKAAGDRFKDCCPMADDLWLHVIALRHGFLVRQIDASAREFTGVPRSSHSALQRLNIGGGRNDVQAASTYSGSDLALLQQTAAA